MFSLNPPSWPDTHVFGPTNSGPEPRLANVSASSFPSTPLCPGTQCKVPGALRFARHSQIKLDFIFVPESNLTATCQCRYELCCPEQSYLQPLSRPEKPFQRKWMLRLRSQTIIPQHPVPSSVLKPSLYRTRSYEWPPPPRSVWLSDACLVSTLRTLLRRIM